MTQPLDRVRLGAVVLGIVFVSAVIGYRYLGERDWLDALYMTVITITTVGFGEESQLGSSQKWFTIVVILMGITAAGYTFGGLFQLMVEGEIQQVLGRRRLTMEIERLCDHAIVCGYGRVGQLLVEELKEHHHPFVIVESDAEQVAEGRAQGHLVLAGDATEEEVLLSAQIDQATSLITTLPSDADNVYITLTARNLKPELLIIARGEMPAAQKKLVQAGANRVVMPTSIGAARMAAMVTSPATLDFLELVVGKSKLDVQLAELNIPDKSLLVGSPVAEAEARKKHGLLVVAIRQSDGTMVFNPESEYEISAGETLIVMGSAQDLSNFRREYRV